MIGLISSGHYLSHLYIFSLPPMFPLLKAEFGVSYVELGLAMTAYNLLGGILQAPVGFLVDHLGPRRVLLVGMGFNALAVALMGFADAYWVLLVMAVVAGLGNSVFHPADYAILSGSIGEERLGRAFSIHTFAGFLGGACAPVVVLALSEFVGWRGAFITIGLVGIGVFLAMVVRRDVLFGEPAAAPAATPSGGTGLRLLITAPIVLYLMFFVAYGMASGGLIAFLVSAMINLHGVSLDLANMALTGHLFAVVGGVVLAGVIVGRFTRHLVTIAAALLTSAALISLISTLPMPGIVMVLVLVGVGLGLGIVLPPRDLILRTMTPAGQTGKVFGFVFVGYALGSGLTPLLFGWLLDNDMPALVFLFSGAFMLLALGLVITAKRFHTRSLAAEETASAGAAE